jgi:hypothetical protein
VLVIGGEEENLAGEIKEEEEQRGGRAGREPDSAEAIKKGVCSLLRA